MRSDLQLPSSCTLEPCASKRLLDASRCQQMLPDGSHCVQMALDVSRWLQSQSSPVQSLQVRTAVQCSPVPVQSNPPSSSLLPRLTKNPKSGPELVSSFITLYWQWVLGRLGCVGLGGVFGRWLGWRCGAAGVGAWGCGPCFPCVGHSRKAHLMLGRCTIE